MYKKGGIQTAPQNKYAAVLNPLTLLSLICARSLSRALLHVAAAAEWKKEGKRTRVQINRLTTTTAHTHNYTITTSHTYTLAHSLYILIVLCGDCCCTACLMCVGKHPVHQRLPLLAPCSPAQWRSQVADSHSQCDATQVLESPSSLCMGHKKALPRVASALPCQFLLYPLKTTKRARPIPVALIYTHRHTHAH